MFLEKGILVVGTQTSHLLLSHWRDRKSNQLHTIYLKYNLARKLQTRVLKREYPFFLVFILTKGSNCEQLTIQQQHAAKVFKGALQSVELNAIHQRRQLVQQVDYARCHLILNDTGLILAPKPACLL